MNILVTGCSGFIGSHLCERLIELGYNVQGIDIRELPEDFKYRNAIDFCVQDIREPLTINEIDVIIHLAALPGVYNSTQQPLEYITTNIYGTVNVIEAALRGNCKKIIYASSSTVYGNENNKDKLHTTNHLLSPYAISKKSCELLFDYYSKECKCIGLRFFSVYGPRGRKDMAPYIFINKILNGESILLYGNGSTKRDFTYISDIVDGICNSVEYIDKNDFQHEIFNLGNSKSVTIKHFLSIIENQLDTKAHVRHLEKRECDSDFTHADLHKSSALLDYRPVISLEEGISNTITWMKKNV